MGNKGMERGFEEKEMSKDRKVQRRGGLKMKASYRWWKGGGGIKEEAGGSDKERQKEVKREKRER